MLILIFILGLIIGSFLNVAIYRLPRNESIITNRSHCTNCGHILSPLELIPVISYIILRGKCKECGSQISARYPLVEIITAILFAMNYLYFNNLINIISGLIFCSIMIVLALIDYDHQILPDYLTLGGLAIGLILSLLRTNISLFLAVTGFLSAGGLLFIIAYLSNGGLGGGDIKLMAMVGSFLGPLSTIGAIFTGALIGLIASLPNIISGEFGMKSKIPFGPFLVIASIIFWFWGSSLWQWYFELLL